MQKKIPVKTLYLLLVISIGLIGLGVGSTFAMFTATAEIDNPISLTYSLDYGYDVIETVEATVSANTDRTITLNITNSTSSNLNYSCFYITSNNRIELGTDLSHNTIGTINARATIPLNVTIRNNTSSEETIVIGVLSNKESITLSEEMRVIPNRELPAAIKSASEMISNLFNKTGTVTENPTGGADAVELDVDTTHQLVKDEAGNIRYYGTGITSTGGTYKEPDNYIDIGDRDSSNNPILWRIIGVFDNQLKLIRSTYITADNNIGLSWDTSVNGMNSGWGANQWGPSGYYDGADLMKLLNPTPDGTSYEGINGSLYWDSESGTCYTGQNNATSSCDFTSTGLSSAVKDKIADAIWYLGGLPDSAEYPNLMYSYEKEPNFVSNPMDTITRTATWIGKIGLAYPSDYGYATDLSKCSQTLNNYGNSDLCRGNNWMWRAMTGANNNASEGMTWAWLITPSSMHQSYVLNILMDGTVYQSGRAHNPYGVSPVLYLRQAVLIEGGNGTSNDPYLLNQDTLLS